ncbi:hypothetical protein HUK65_18265, partial [Rhodobacteraceae bacterium 2376]
ADFFRALDRAHGSEAVRLAARSGVPFGTLIVDAEIANLHEGNALRFGIRRSQFEAWVRRKEA